MRPNCEEFAGQLHSAAIESVETVGRWMPWCHTGHTQHEGTEWLRKCQTAWDAGEQYEFTLFDHAGEYLGAAGLNQFNRVHNFANLGYWGLAMEAIGLLAEFGFQAVGLTRIEIVAASDNLRSRRVAEMAGATFEGPARNRIVIRGIPIPAAVYALVPSVGP
jgi:ribosomal-protein-serine acetyltransferase